LGKRFFLTGPDENATVAALPANQELEQLKGRIGRTLSALRPAGVVDFDGRRIDTVTEGMMVDPGQWVRCVDVRAGRVVVRPVDRPDLGRLESDDFG
jgi:membrane-bound serine protease (ClpP class)